MTQNDDGYSFTVLGGDFSLGEIRNGLPIVGPPAPGGRCVEAVERPAGHHRSAEDGPLTPGEFVLSIRRFPTSPHFPKTGVVAVQNMHVERVLECYHGGVLLCPVGHAPLIPENFSNDPSHEEPEDQAAFEAVVRDLRQCYFVSHEVRGGGGEGEKAGGGGGGGKVA